MASRVLYSLEPGVDGQLFMISTLYEALEKGQSCLVIIPHTTVDAFLHDVGHLRGKTIRAKDYKIAFLDSVDRERIQRQRRQRRSGGTGMAGPDQKTLHRKQGRGHLRVFRYHLRGFRPGKRTFPALAGLLPAGIHHHHRAPEPRRRYTSLSRLRSGSPLTLSLRSSPRSGPCRTSITLPSCTPRGQPSLRRSVPFLVRNGHIVPYIPKIVVTRPPESGKSRFVANATELGMSVDRTGLEGDVTTVAMDFGWLHWQDFDITLYGTPGSPGSTRCSR